MRSLLPLLLVACAPTFAPTADPAQEQLIYGNDDRLEVFEVNAALQAAADATVALVSRTDVSISGSTATLNTSQSFGSAYGLCSDEPFRTQPSTAYCSGFLAGDDLIVTAGHCIDSSSCGSTRFVFGFEMTSSSSVQGTVPASEVYSCAEVVARANTNSEDYAVIRLDRAVTGHTPLTMKAPGTLQVGDPLTVIGHPAGIPTKVAGGATVRSNGAAAYFEANLDTYGGNSGSAVFDSQTLEVAGILVRGNTDFVRTGSGCYTSNVCPDGGCPGWEDATRIDLVLPHLSSEPPPPPPGCTDDSLEDNDSQGAATPLSPGLLSDMAICSGDDDWFELQVNAGDSVSASMSFSHAVGDLDLTLYDEQGQLDTSVSTSNSESVSGDARADGSAWVRVYGYNGASNDSYDLDLDVSTPPPPPPPTAVCGDGVCDMGESCDGRADTQRCRADCDGKTNGKPSRRFCVVEGVCEGPGCP